MRMFWPDGCVGALEIDRNSPGFWNKCINEFLRYYTYDPRFATEAEAMASILAHMRDNLRSTLSDDRERADVKIAGASGTTYADHRPLYMKPSVCFVSPMFMSVMDVPRSREKEKEAPADLPWLAYRMTCSCESWMRP
ncbi:hypothetical protein POM88_020279 [Heracleum sosnowskyi]|uniref:Uncharacterized protein n=1 Tax=Heracleum sosnowskyi TaxID=360622 RepID=A0AAD8ICH6_9APIA|nr:hypothetical protein POM88_020279 [Heracleum sosnowskyi]